MRFRGIVFCMVTALLVLAANGQAMAADKDKARAAMRRGVTHYNLSEFSPALEAFKEAYRNYPDASFIFNIAQCHRQLGHKEEALRFYRTFLHEMPNAPNLKAVQEVISSLEKALDDERMAKIRAPHNVIRTDNVPVPAVTSEEAAPNPAEEKAPAAAQVQPQALTVEETASRRDEQPVYKKWWLWTVVGAVVVGTAVGLGVGLAPHGGGYPSGNTTDGTARFPSDRTTDGTFNF